MASTLFRTDATLLTRDVSPYSKTILPSSDTTSAVVLEVLSHARNASRRAASQPADSGDATRSQSLPGNVGRGWGDCAENSAPEVSQTSRIALDQRRLAR